MASRFIIQDGIKAWFEGPEWDEVIEQVFREAAPQIESYAQQNAPWEDQTGEARDGLTAKAFRDGDNVALELAHTVDYGFWLEVIQNGRFAIILPTLESQGPAVMRKARDAVANARKGKTF